MTAPGPLTGITVLELGDAARFAGKLLADLGATVTLVEPPEGSPSRRVGPYAGDVPHPDQSLYFWAYNAGKRSHVLDPRSPGAADALATLAAGADVVLDGLPPGTLDRLGTGPTALRTGNPALIYASVSPYGADGPWTDHLGSDLVALALGGSAAMSGYDDLPGEDSTPIAPSGGQAAHLTGEKTAIAVLLALAARDRGVAGGQDIELATHDAVATSNEWGVPFWVFQRAEVYRHTARHASAAEHTPPQMFRCKDGRYILALTIYVKNDRRFSELVAWLEEYGFAEDLRDPAYGERAFRDERFDHIVGVIERFCAHLTSDELFHEGQRRRLPWAPVNRPEDLLTDPHLNDREAFTRVTDAATGLTPTYPGAPYRLSRTPWAIRAGAPRLGEHTDEGIQSS